MYSTASPLSAGNGWTVGEQPLSRKMKSEGGGGRGAGEMLCMY